MHEYQLFPIAIEIHIYGALMLKFYSQALEERLRAHGEGISSLHHGILRMLQAETLTISELSQRLGYDPSSLVRAIDTLEHRGLAQRHSDPADRRRNPITITEKGSELIAGIPVVAAEDPIFQALQSLGIESATQLRDLLRDVIVEFPEGRLVVDLIAGQMDRP